jgi:endonuclease-3
MPTTRTTSLPKDAHARAPVIVQRLAAAYPNARCALNHRNPLELLVATVLSAQCTDERVNIVTRDLFTKYRSAAEYAAASQRDMERAVRSTGFFRNKARSIRACCRMLVEQYNGAVPDRMEALVELPGVGRKTANVILGTAMGQASGVVVDTHVRRLANRMGLTRHSDPEKIEQDLMKLIPSTEWVSFGHRMIQHGRRVCSARAPQCEACSVNDVCPKIGVRNK